MVLRRYTPPTCTLEITAKTSPLSRWTGKSVFKDLQFTLHFDDPRLLKEDHLTLVGDRSQLESLQEAISVYVQTFLSQSLTQLNNVFLKAEVNSQGHSEEVPAPLYALNPAPSTVTESSPPLPVEVDDLKSEQNHHAVDLFSPATGFHYNPEGIYLQPGTHLDHILFLGNLATPETGKTLQLTVLQLFDLATALDECLMDVMTLPSLNVNDTPAPTPAWVRNVAILLVTVGVSAGALHLLNQEPQPASQTARVETPATEGIQLSPLPVPSGRQAPITSKSPTPTIPPNPNFPTSGISPKPVVIPSPVQVPAPIFPSAAPPPPPPPGDALSSGEQNVIVIMPDSAPPPPSERVPVPQAPRPMAPPPGPVAAPGAPFGAQPIPPDLGTAGVELPPLQDSDIASNADPASSKAVEGEMAPSQEEGTLFDVIPQVTEVRTYFEETWQPPAELTEILQYQLVLQADGSIGQIIPLGKASADYIDRTQIPLVGEPFVSEVPGGSRPKIRLVLRPDGKVQTFLESN